MKITNMTLLRDNFFVAVYACMMLIQRILLGKFHEDRN